MSQSGNGINTKTRTMTSRLKDEDLLALVPARSGRRDVGIGIFVATGIVAALLALFMLTDAATFRGRYIVTTMVEDAGGIRRGDPVQMRGVNIGRVQRFDITSKGVAVRLELEGEYDVPRDSRVALRSNGLLGGMVADVVPGTASENLRGGDVMPGGMVEGAFEAAADIGTRADAALGQVQRLLSEQNVDNVGAGAAELRALLRELTTVVAEQRRELNQLTSSLNRSATGLERVTSGPELGRIATRGDSVMIRMDQASMKLERVSGSLETMLARMERGEGTLGRLTKDEALYENMNNAAANLNRLVEEMRADPKKYFSVRVF
jgi:phospholipid/cholesterol/gamma-HCH transport system substrate-binding protein